MREQSTTREASATATADPDDAAGARRAFVLGRWALAVTCCALLALALGVFTQVAPATTFFTHG